METIKNTSVLIVLAGIFYGIYQFATGSEAIFPNHSEVAANQSENLAQFVDNPAASAEGNPQQNSGLQNSNSLPNINPLPSGGNMGSDRPLAGSQNLDGNPSERLSNSPLPQVNNGLGSQRANSLQRNPFPKTEGMEQNGLGQQRNSGFENKLPNGNNLDQISISTGLMSNGQPNQGMADQERTGQNSFPNRHTDFQQAPGSSGQNRLVSGLDGREYELSPIGGGSVSGSNLPAYHSQLKMALQNASQEIQRNQAFLALQKLTPWLDRQLLPEDRARLLEWLDQLASDVIYSSKHRISRPYQSQAGDTFRNLANRLKITPYMLANINQRRVDNFDAALPVGTELKVIQGPFHAKTNLKTKELTIFLGEKGQELYAGRFQYKLGKSAPISDEISQVSHISLNGMSAEFVGGGQPIQPLAQGNPYGRYCIRFGSNVLHSDGNRSGSGCLILSEQDMIDLIAIMDKQSTISVQR